MGFEAFDYFVFQLFFRAVITGSTFLLLFNVTLAIYGWARAITKL